MVKCAECGYLGVRHAERQELVCPNMVQRVTGNPATKPEGPVCSGVNEWLVTEIAPSCAVGAMDIGSEYIEQRSANRKFADKNRKPYRGYFVGRRNADVSAAKEVMQEERDCRKFKQWIPGLTPREHIAMNMIDEIQERWRQNDKKQDRKDIFLICLGAFAAAAAWWAALRLPGVPPLPQLPPPAATAPATTAPANLDK